MSRSYKKPIVKYKPRNQKRTPQYHKQIRRRHNQTLTGHANLIRDEYDSFELGEPVFANPKMIVNDYIYCDYITRISDWNDEEEKIKHSRR